MEPKLPAPHAGPERSAGSYGPSVEQAPLAPNIERKNEQGAERFEQRAETVEPTRIAPVLPAPVTISPPVQDENPAGTVSDEDLPVVANDEDLIEKEWVDKAKKIIVQTKDDPYRREQEVGKLQVDYLRKRYGKELGAPQQADM